MMCSCWRKWGRSLFSTSCSAISPSRAHVYAHAFVLDGPDPERHVALLSKRAWKTVTPHTDLEFLYRGSMEKVKPGPA